MKRFLAIALAALLLLVPMMGALAEDVVLTMGSWRADDVEQMNRLLSIYKDKTGVEIQFQPTTPADYNATLRLQLDAGTGPDLMYARSYATGVELFDRATSRTARTSRGLMENFTPTNLAPWQTADGKMFAVPFAAVSHAVYYNKDIFAKEGIEIPTTFEELLAVCEKLQAAGITPFANGVAEEWDILECFFLGMLPNYIGGAEERVKYENGEKKLNDEAFVSAFTDLAAVSPYLPKGFEAVNSQRTARSCSPPARPPCSWTARGRPGTYSDVGFEWGVFAMPARAGGKTAITFHPDMAITMNTKTAHPEEARAFLAWLCTEEGVNARGGEPAGRLLSAHQPARDARGRARGGIPRAQRRQGDGRALRVAEADGPVQPDEPGGHQGAQGRHHPAGSGGSDGGGVR